MLCSTSMLNFEKLLQDAPLPDKRLRDRAALLFQSLLGGQSANSTGLLSPADRTQESFTRAAYRFFDHDAVSLPALHAPMQQALPQLVPPRQRALVAHDVSVLNFSGHQRKEDLIPVGNDRTWGYELYQALVISADSQPLGSAFTELRSSQGLHSSQSDRPLPFTDHLEQTERAVDALEQLLPGRELVHLCDREFDDLKLLRHLDHSRYVIRCQHLSRRVTVHGQQQSLRQHLERLELAAAGQVVRRYEQSTQTYQLLVGESVVTMHGPSQRGVARRRNRPQKGAALRVRVIVSELRQPGQKPLRWVLLTNLEDSALSVVQCYCRRWQIERLFYFAKVGFRLECWHQESAERIARRLLLVQLAAMAVYQLRHATDEKTVEIMHKLAKLGGWSGRAAVPIGPTMLMRGALLFLSTVQLLQLYSKKDLLSMARSLEPLLGPILRRRGEK